MIVKRKLILGLLLIAFASIKANSQSNSFPTNGNATIADGNLIQTGAYNIQTQGAVKLKNYLLFDNDGDFTGNNYFTIQDDAVGNYLRFGYGFNDHLILSSLGNVGIGTTDPKSPLHVTSDYVDLNSTAAIDANLLIQATNGGRDDDKGAVLGFALPSTAPNSGLWQHGRIMVVPDNPNNSQAAGKMYLQARYYQGSGLWQWRNNLVLDNEGDVGIGTDDPLSLLHLKQNGPDAIRFERASHDTYDIYVGGSKGLYFHNRTDGRYEMVFAGNGDVGIGTDSPSSKLEVDGTITSEEVKVQVVTPPDYVFAPEYQLRSLKETEVYIKANSHLPEIPSAKEMEANGVELGEMNMLLLKKIEELTLHLIDKDKTVNDLLNRVEKLENQNNEN